MSQRLSYTVLDDGTIITDVIGADPEEENDPEGDEDEDLDDDENDDDSGDEDEDEDDEDEDTVESLRERLEAAEKARKRAEFRMKRADRAKSQADKKLKNLEKSDASKDLVAANNRIAELEDQIAKGGGVDRTSLIRDEFRDLDTFEWHNPKAAFQLLDVSEIDVENGTVDAEALSFAVEELAKAHPYLLVGSKKNDKEDDDEDERPRRKSPSGNQPRRKKKTTDRAALTKKFPVLASRG